MPAALPKVVWMLWFQGWADPPPIVQSCRRSWEAHNPGWELRLIDADDVAHLPRVADLAGRRPAAASDIVRAHLLREHGGVWADATSFCVRPLDSWLAPRFAGSVGDARFFAFDSPGHRRMISSWLLACEPGAYVMQTWCEATDRYWSGRETPDEYFWFHFLFADLYRTEPRFHAAWDASPHLPADIPLYFSPYDERYTGPMSRRVRARLAAAADPVYKLTTRFVKPDAVVSPHSAYQWFVDGGTTELPSSAAWRVADQALWVSRSKAKRAVNRARGRVGERTGVSRGA